MKNEKPFIVSPISIEKLNNDDSPFGQENRFRMMIYRCVTDPSGNFSKLKNNMDGNIEVFMNKEHINELKNMLVEILAKEGDDTNI